MAEVIEEPLPLDEAVRTLASIQIVDQILIHDNADTLEIAAILGWKVVVKKEQFKVGDKVVFFEIDCVLPSDAHWSQVLVKDKFRVKTKKLRGFLSQGLALSAQTIFDGQAPNCDHMPIDQMPVGFDLTDVLGVKKYGEVPDTYVYSSPTLDLPWYLHPFPKNIPKTDEPRLQSNMKLFEALRGFPYYITVKVDGCSATYLVPKQNQQLASDSCKLIICSRNYTRQQPPSEGEIAEDVYWQVAKDYGLEDKLAKCPGFAVQAELYGPTIQDNRLNVSKLTFAAYNVFDIGMKKYLNFAEFVDFCKKLNLPTVPIIEEGQRFEYDSDALIEKAKGEYPNTKNPREGLVVRCQDENIYKQQRLSFKVINNDFLLKYDS